MLQEILVRSEDAVGEPIVAHELPDVFHRIELGRFRRQGDDGDVRRNDEPRRQMPAGLIEQQHRMSARLDRGGDLGQMQAHRVCVAGGQDQSRALAFARTDGAEDVG